MKEKKTFPLLIDTVIFIAVFFVLNWILNKKEAFSLQFLIILFGIGFTYYVLRKLFFKNKTD
ncbi:hypothetical protein GCM10007380_28540 [Gottfriedia solisilvae]|uniref:Uncharacterized protein n=1 Tax=Gottfriedia solisilvae TaxID=1516104 RepID=A0A8J3AMP8_9BACI|nr:hypothetical protein GCM10007380_28540 [Gottfriedia solisilvae]